MIMNSEFKRYIKGLGFNLVFMHEDFEGAATQNLLVESVHLKLRLFCGSPQVSGADWESLSNAVNSKFNKANFIQVLSELPSYPQLKSVCDRSKSGLSGELICLGLYHWLSEYIEHNKLDIKVESIDVVEGPIGVKLNSLQHKNMLQLALEEVAFLKSSVVKLSCVHKHENKQLSKAENQSLFKKCSHFHGHEYEVKVLFKGRVLNGLVSVMADSYLLELLNTQLKDRLNHKIINAFVENTTGENLSKFIYDKLRAIPLRNVQIHEVQLLETVNNEFYYSK
ncbi:MAG: hypothetical protein HOO06_11515 [Bdellovibrionaceae bacterium]|jgi:6-pyruvoyltetrahydropterin/6-carboxytetrahydropterin synthase|nr:hypothetical protein [Pseudobdellovibrionaceae bacterium]